MRRLDALAVSIAVAGIACLVNASRTSDAPEAVPVRRAPGSRQTVESSAARTPALPEAVESTDGSASAEAPRQTDDLATILDRLLFDGVEPLTAADVAACVEKGLITRRLATAEALKRLTVDARGRGRLVSPEEAAVMLRADDAASPAIAELAAAYFDAPTHFAAHARLRELIADWPASRRLYVAVTGSDAEDVERRVAEAFATGDEAARDAIRNAFVSWARSGQRTEAVAAARGLLASGDAAAVTRLLAAAADALEPEGESRSLSGYYTIASALTSARRQLVADGSPLSGELLRVAAESESAGARRIALFAFSGEFGDLPNGREFLEAIVRRRDDGRLAAGAIRELGSIVSPSELIALGTGLSRGPDDFPTLAFALAPSVRKHPEERSVVVEFLRTALEEDSMRGEFLLRSIRDMRLVELESEVREIAESGSAPRDLGDQARRVLESFQDEPPDDLESAAAPVDRELVAAIRAAESALRNMRLEGLTTYESWDAERGAWIYKGEIAFTAHFPGVHGGRWRVHRHRHVMTWHKGASAFAFEEEIEAFDGRAKRSLLLQGGTLEAPSPSRSGRIVRRAERDEDAYTQTGWVHSLFGLGRNRIPLSELLAWRGVRTRFDESGLLVVGTGGSGSQTMRFDPKRGYALVSSEMRISGKLVDRLEVHGFRAAGDGIVYPSSATSTQFASSGEPKSRARFEYSAAVANDPGFDDDVFKLGFPEGTHVEDTLAGGEYVVDADRVQSKEPPPAPVAIVMPPTPLAPSNEASTPAADAALAAVAPEPSSSPSRAPWLAGGIALLAAAALLGVLSRRRAAAG